MRTNFEKIVKQDKVFNNNGKSTEWAEHRSHMKKRHKTKRGTSDKRNWS